jgi:hypothetical protein
MSIIDRVFDTKLEGPWTEMTDGTSLDLAEAVHTLCLTTQPQLSGLKTSQNKQDFQGLRTSCGRRSLERVHSMYTTVNGLA